MDLRAGGWVAGVPGTWSIPADEDSPMDRIIRARDGGCRSYCLAADRAWIRSRRPVRWADRRVGMMRGSPGVQRPNGGPAWSG